MKGILKSRDNGKVFPFTKKVTTLGRDGCDITVQASAVEKEHAIIELDDNTGSFCIRDLNTPHGTYVNDCRVQNSAVKIATGDVIRFGHNGPTFEVEIDSSSFYCPPIYSQQAWGTSQSATESNAIGTQFPYLPSRMSADEIASHDPPGTNLPYPPPSHHGGRFLDQSGPSMVMPHPPARSRLYVDTGKHRPKSHTGIHDSLSVTFSGGLQNTFSNTEDRIQELEQRLLKMGDELSRLASFEAECYRKDSVIVTLRNEIADWKSRTQGSQVDGVFSFTPRVITNTADILQGDNQFLKNLLSEKEENEKQNIQRFAHLQAQLSLKDKEITRLEDELTHLKSWNDNSSLTERYTEKIATLQSEISKKEQLIFSLQNDLEKSKKQKSQSSNLVNTLQRESSAKDSIINKVRNESDRLKKEIKEKENHISALSTKLARQTVLKEAEAENQRKVEEIVTLKQKIRNLETQLREKHNIIQNLQDELQMTRAQISSGQKNDRVLQQELHQTRNQFVDIERSERSLKIELRDWQNKFEKFQRKLVQAIYRLGVPSPNREIDEDDIVQQVRLICEERVDLQQKTQELSEQMDKDAAVVQDMDKWKHKFEKALGRLEKKMLKNGRHCNVLEEEASYFKEMKVPEEFAWIKLAISNLLVQEHRWQQDLEEALEDVGFSREEQMKEPINLIQELKAKMADRADELEGLKRKLSNVTRVHEDEITKLKTKLIEEAQESASDSIAIIKREEEEKRDKLINKFERHKRDAIQDALAEERRAFQNEYGDLVELRKRCNENQREADECRAKMIILEQKTSQLQASLDQLQHKETLSQKQLEDQETHHRVQLESIEKEREEFREKVQEDVNTFKEQARQHSLTIVALEERVLKLNQERKNLELENMRYKQYGPDLYNGEGLDSPKRKTVSKSTSASRVFKRDVAVSTGEFGSSDRQLKEQCHKLEQLLDMLRKEMANMENENQQKDDVIRRMKKELTTASARLSDMTGELDDIQKQKIDELRAKLRKQDEEMQEQRGQLVKLSALIDEQKEELLKRERALAKHQDLLVKQKEEIDSRTQEIVHMREIHEAERDGLDDEMTRLAEEKLQTRDLKSAGARCIGEKHEDIIRRQKVALSDLRSVIKSQGMAPIVTTQEAALSQIGALKKEVTDLRYQLATRDQDLYKSGDVLQEEARASRELMFSASQEANVEKLAHRETVAALDASEQSYVNLLRAVAEILDIEKIPGTEIFAHIPHSETQKLFKEREKGLKMIIKSIQSLQERLGRKEKLLDDYEKDLNSLRKTENLVGKKSAEALSLATNVRSQKDEIAYLRESLNRLREELDQQKRLNKSLSERKVFMMDYKEKEGKKSSHNCAQDDEKRYKEDAKKKKQEEKMKRKNYEIESLKRELHFADRELNQTAARLHAMGSQGFRSQFEKDLSPDD